MTFPEALDAVFKDNDRITRATWANRNIYCALEEGRLCIKGFASEGSDDGLFHPWVITEQDFFAHDWEIIADA